MNKELMEAIEILEREKDINRDVLFDAIENSLISAYKNHFSKNPKDKTEGAADGGVKEYDNVRVDLNRETGEYKVYSIRSIVEEVTDPIIEINLEDAKKKNKRAEIGMAIAIEVQSKDFGRIATSTAKNVILQKIREEERSMVYNQFHDKERQVVTGIVQREVRNGISINLGKADAILMNKEMVEGENYKPTDRIKVYVVEVKSTTKGPKISVSRTHPELVRKLFEAEVTEMQDNTVEIKAISREAGSRTKIAVWSNSPDVDPVGACVGVNGARVNMIVDELNGEKIDIVNWSDNSAVLIENALSPAKVISVIADNDERSAKVTVPDNQLSLAIGIKGQNARLAARLTGFKIDIKSESQAADTYGFRLEDYMDEQGELSKEALNTAEGDSESNNYVDEEISAENFSEENDFPVEE